MRSATATVALSPVYGLGMDTLWGCVTEDMDELVERIVRNAERLRRLIELLRGTSGAVAWTGPDADVHRARTSAVTTEAADLCGVLRERAEQLQEESAQQTVASRADAGMNPLERVRAEWPDLRPARSPDGPNFPEFHPFQPGFSHPIELENVPTLRDLIDRFEVPDLGPMIGGPFGPTRRPLPEGEEYDIPRDALDQGESLRRTAMRLNPYTAGAQMLMDLHSAKGGWLDSAESFLVDNGMDSFVPFVDMARIPHANSSLVVGEGSTIGQVTREIDVMMANASHTTGEVTDALGRGDLGGAVRAGERGVYRQYEGLAAIATASPIWNMPDTGGDIAGHAADVLEPISPFAAEQFRKGEEQSHALGEYVTSAREEALDSENWYDARRRAIPLPWDPQ